LGGFQGPIAHRKPWRRTSCIRMVSYTILESTIEHIGLNSECHDQFSDSRISSTAS
jgi:hypothetical protein